MKYLLVTIEKYKQILLSVVLIYILFQIKMKKFIYVNITYIIKFFYYIY